MTTVEEPVARCPGERPPDVLRRDVVAPPSQYLEEHWTHQGTHDVDRERYWTPEFHQLEVEHVWRKVWQVACREEDLPAVGDHVVYDIAQDSLLVVRTAPDVIKAFYNSCLHRGATLRDTGGRVARFVCPFHGFTWSLDGALVDVPGAWDFPQIRREEFALPEAHVGRWGGYVFVNLSPTPPEALLDYLGVLPAEFAFRPLEDRWKSAHVRKVVPCNWKIALEAFAEAYHVVRTHPQALPFTADLSSQYDVYRHVSRMINLLGVPSPHVADTADDVITQALRTPGGSAQRPAHLSARQFAAQEHRQHYESRLGVDLSAYTDAEILDAIQYHVFPNFSPWAGVGQPIQYTWRPNGNDPESSVMDVMFLSPVSASGERPPAAPLVELGPEDPWTAAKILGKYGPIFDQDQANFARIQKGVKAGRKGNTYSVYQESKIRHFHATLDGYINRGRAAV
jgi:phenylpropionate dioxygenase-like ring-hydroxylating dioxygenase large terminal subunit